MSAPLSLSSLSLSPSRHGDAPAHVRKETEANASFTQKCEDIYASVVTSFPNLTRANNWTDKYSELTNDRGNLKTIKSILFMQVLQLGKLCGCKLWPWIEDPYILVCIFTLF